MCIVFFIVGLVILFLVILICVIPSDSYPGYWELKDGEFKRRK